MTVKQGAKTAMPRLRFPGFRQAGGWTAAKLGELFTDRQETGATDLPLLSLMDKEGIVPQEETNRKDNSNADKSKYLRVVPGDIAYNTMRMWEGRSAYVDMEGLISPAYTVCAPNEGTYSRFFSYYFKTEWLISQFRKYSQGLVKDTLNLKFDNFKRVEVAYPSNVQEQQKIAACLASLDEVIAAQGRKVEALKTHKRGLMQQLFPREGETRPRLRFHEFRNAPEWDQKSLEELGKIVTGKTPSTKDPSLWNGSVLFITPTDIDGDAKYQQRTQRHVAETSGVKILPVGSIAYTCIASVGKMAITAHPSATNQQINAIVVHGDVSNEFLFYALVNLTPWIKTISASSTLPIINKSEFSAICVRMPSDAKEQRRIADCLCSLDTRISAEAHHLAALETHKQGLMQQLFPAPETSGA